MLSVPQLVRTEQDAVVLVEATGLACVAAAAPHVVFVDAGAAVCGAEQVDFGFEEANDGGVLEEPFLVLFAAGAVAGFVDVVADREVGFALGWSGVAGHYTEEGRPGVD